MIQYEGEWAVRRIEAPASVDVCRLAQANEALPGNWKYVLESPGDQLCLRLDAIEQDSQDLCDPTGSSGSPRVPPTADWLSGTLARIGAAGYSVHAREDRLTVSVDAWQMEIAPSADGGVLLSISVGTPASETPRQAIALLLLRAGGCVRIVRGFMTILPHAKAGFMARLPPAYSDEQFTEVAEAIAACLRRFQKSVSVLENEFVAERYLALSTVYSNQHQGELQTC